MRSAFVTRAPLMLMLVLSACGQHEKDSGDGIDTNIPASFENPCAGDAAICEEPFTCLPNSASPQARCSVNCDSDADCPSWEATGHCAGFTQALCQAGVCRHPKCL